MALSLLGQLHFTRRELDDAEFYLRRALAIQRRQPDGELGTTLMILAGVMELRGQADAARGLRRRARALGAADAG